MIVFVAYAHISLAMLSFANDIIFYSVAQCYSASNGLHFNKNDNSWGKESIIVADGKYVVII